MEHNILCLVAGCTPIGSASGNSGVNPGLPRSGKRKRPPSNALASFRGWEAMASRPRLMLNELLVRESENLPVTERDGS